MKKPAFAILAAVFCLISAFTIFKTPTWKISPDFSIRFSSKNPNGEFRDFKGSIKFDPKNLMNSSFKVNLAVDSIDTGIKLKNKHAVGEHWFDAKKYPLISFTSGKITKTEEGFQVVGDLEMHGIKRAYTIPFEFEETTPGGVFTSIFKVNRNDFNIGKPGGKVPDEMTVVVRVPVIRE